jgi:hypothetical protein
LRYAVTLKDFIGTTATAMRDDYRAKGYSCSLCLDHLGEYLLVFSDPEGACCCEAEVDNEHSH